METKWMKLYVDFAFKRLFGSQENERILMAFLNAMLKPAPEKRITSVTILDKELGREYVEDKNAILDLHAWLDDGSKVNIEIQLANEHNLQKRSLYYWGRTYMEGFQKRGNYADLPRTISINITGFSLFPDHAERYHMAFELREREAGFLWDDTLELHLVEMPKLVRLWREKRIGMGQDELVEWLLLLEAGDDEDIRKELEVRAMDNPALQEAMEKWEDLSRDPEAIREYEARHKALMDQLSVIKENERRQQQRYEEGKEEGRIEEKRVIALKMLADGMPIEQITNYSGLFLEEVKKLKKNG
ncbi:Rpn family recombination-promoting nuclease/putative transposase [Aneurinibacillus tyrosinisolvens]|uniref:Rpn family recombination-promoting nuclease/putative transposase n=1 Tax=Aneurinibacillus tyrosinisolvens TaxID=1443435 RepID=UPI00069A5C44|nr:Rpn family recombination-promoting nuclease/putative transposase [Aneurinibacillus tyrosinisolvens]